MPAVIPALDLGVTKLIYGAENWEIKKAMYTVSSKPHQIYIKSDAIIYLKATFANTLALKFNATKLLAAAKNSATNTAFRWDGV